MTENEEKIQRIKVLYGNNFWLADNESDDPDLNKCAEYYSSMNYSREGTETNEYLLAVAKYCFIAGANFQKNNRFNSKLIMETHTRGNVIIENIKIGDIHYEFGYGLMTKCEVIQLPILNENGSYEWKSKNLLTGNVIDYLVNPEYSHYSIKLYDYEAYIGCEQI